MITITGIGDRDRPEWMIRITGIRTSVLYSGFLRAWARLIASVRFGLGWFSRSAASMYAARVSSASAKSQVDRYKQVAAFDHPQDIKKDVPRM